jgi:hypothetical protein
MKGTYDVLAASQIIYVVAASGWAEMDTLLLIHGTAVT